MDCVVCRTAVVGPRCEACDSPVSAGSFRVRGRIHDGPRSRVFLAQGAEGSQLALKEIFFARVPDAKAIADFEREGTLLRQLSHPTIPRFVASFAEGTGRDKRFYIAQEYIEGQTLLDLVSNGRLIAADAVAIARDVLRSLTYLHGLSPCVLHRDVKPANLIMRPNGCVALVDFGSARDVRPGGTHRATVAGTFGYSPPEALGGTVDETTDLYGLGATLVHVLTRRPPEEVLWPESAPLDSLINAPDAFVDWLSKLTAHRPRDRFRTAVQALEALEKAEKQRGLSVFERALERLRRFWRPAREPRTQDPLRAPPRDPVTSSAIVEIVERKPAPKTGATDGPTSWRTREVTGAVQNLEFGAEFEGAFRLIHETKGFFFLTGHAGTGKSTFVQEFRRRSKARTAIVAPTGVAALNAGGQTIHSFFRLPSRLLRSSDAQALRDQSLLQRLEILIIDEVSMVRPDVLDAIDASLKLNRRNQQPFGGLTVVGVGDLAQLPPVVRSQERALFNEFYKDRWFFSAECLHDGVPDGARKFTRVFRQQDPEFIALLDAIREGGRHSALAVGRFNERCLDGSPIDTDRLVLTTTNAIADRTNHAMLQALPTAEQTYDALTTGTFAEAPDSRKPRPAPERLGLRVGARVCILRNDIDERRRWVNGSTGVVVRLTLDTVVVELDDVRAPSNRVDIARVRWEDIKYVYDEREDKITSLVVGTFEQFPLNLAWAMTIHKSQGKTFERVGIDFGTGTFECGQAYVALSRCRSLVGIKLARPLVPSDVKTDPAVNAFLRRVFGEGESSQL